MTTPQDPGAPEPDVHPSGDPIPVPGPAAPQPDDPEITPPRPV